jgi:hypothetical protein
VPIKCTDVAPPRFNIGKEQLDAFHEFQMTAAVRAAYVADSSELVFSRQGPGGEWGLGLGNHAQAAIVDLVGLSFVPLYRFIGPASMLVILVLFLVTICAF